jgi:hypothetical protein
MSKLSFVILSLIVAACSAFAPMAQVRNTVVSTPIAGNTSPFVLNMAEDTYTYWEAEYPPSKVLGPLMSKMPSGLLGMVSLVFLGSLEAVPTRVDNPLSCPPTRTWSYC